MLGDQKSTAGLGTLIGAVHSGELVLLCGRPRMVQGSAQPTGIHER
jgi:hypothetical protein